MPTSSRRNTIDIRKRGDEGIAPYKFRIGSRNNILHAKATPWDARRTQGVNYTV